MPAPSFRTTRMALAWSACAVAAGCGSFDGATQRMAGSITPYKVEVVQGNFVSKEQVETLKPGMSRQQVREVLGTPLMASIFHTDRWDYVFTLKRQGTPPQARKLTVYFKDNVMERAVGDEMPTEAEFVATLDAKRRSAKVPQLEVSEEALARLPARAATGAGASTAAAESAPATPIVYPPLEPTAR